MLKSTLSQTLSPLPPPPQLFVGAYRVKRGCAHLGVQLCCRLPPLRWDSSTPTPSHSERSEESLLSAPYVPVPQLPIRPDLHPSHGIESTYDLSIDKQYLYAIISFELLATLPSGSCCFPKCVSQPMPTTVSRPLLAPFFSCTYKPHVSQLLSFDTLTNAPRAGSTPAPNT